MTLKQQSMLSEKTTKGKVVKFERYPVGYVEDEVSLIAGEYKHFLQRIRLHSGKAAELKSRYGYRWCYYSLSGDKLPFGQFALLLSERALRKLLLQARKRGWQI